MNILIVGNGFDLSHYLPTKYDHFMDVMVTIEDKETGGLPSDLRDKKIDYWLKQIDSIFEKRKGFAPPPYHMNFEELYTQTRDPDFIDKTKEYYLTENIEICSKDVLKLQYRLEMNCWYRYFKSHVEEIKTWIDFEEKIKEVIYSISNAISFITESNEANQYRFSNSKLNAAISKRTFGVLKFFDVFEGEGAYKSFNPVFCNGEDVKNGFSLSSLLEYAQKQLDDFIEIFNLYLELVIDKLQLKTSLEIFVKSNSLFEPNKNYWIKPDLIYSFNYTNTYQRIHDNVEVYFLHGSSGEEQNIVLGISDLENDALKKLKAYGFTKYHQKLFKDTNYLFLDESKNKILAYKKRVEDFEKNYQKPNKEYYRDALRFEEKLNLNFYIWGHSLDLSDKDYIIDLFSLNDDIDRNVRVTVYHFNIPAKFDLLNNLLAILGKEKVEKWMKKKWLQFQPNPEIKFDEIISEKTA